MRAALFTALLGLCAAPALAHTSVIHLSPARNSVVSAPSEVSLRFNEEINLRFSRIEVHRLPTQPSKASTLEVNKAAAQYAKTVFAQPKQAAQSLVSLPPNLPTTQGQGKVSQLTLPLKPKLTAGHYVIVWRILSADGHPVTGYSPFQIKAAE